MTREPAPEHGGGLVRVRMDLAYDGAAFSGWARQPGLRTVQGTVEDTLATVLRLPTATATCAGRTDAGVHARGQVLHTDLPTTALESVRGRSALPWPQVLVRRANRVLPDEVRVRACAAAPSGFDARFGALWRRYAYRVCDNAAAADPLRRGHVLWWPRPLDLDAMNTAAAQLVGEHDFAAFCRRREGASTVRELQRLSWQREPDGLAVLHVRADAFCHHMVRALAGALLAVGEGRRPAGWPGEVLAARRRDPAVSVLPAHGLTLEEVGYPPDDELGARSSMARRLRVSGG